MDWRAFMCPEQSTPLIRGPRWSHIKQTHYFHQGRKCKVCEAQSELQSDEQVQMNFGTLRRSAVPSKYLQRSKGRLSKKHGFMTRGLRNYLFDYLNRTRREIWTKNEINHNLWSFMVPDAPVNISTTHSLRSGQERFWLHRLDFNWLRSAYLEFFAAFGFVCVCGVGMGCWEGYKGPYYKPNLILADSISTKNRSKVKLTHSSC